MKLRVFLVVGCVLAVVAGAILWRLADHDLEHRESVVFDVDVAGHQIEGTLWLPEGAALAVVALVHGDGAQDRTSFGGYAPMINALLDRGIAVASWDKPGVGSSGGDWLHQSMSDRTAETRAVLHLLSTSFEGVPIGALGFSQAGWVLPSLSPQDADFLVMVGAAVSWQDQGAYYTAVRLRNEGLGPEEIASALAQQAGEDARLFGPEATVKDVPEGMSPDRWEFIRRNWEADARRDLSALEVPVLALWGAEDLNVDPERNAAEYKRLLGARHASTRVAIVPEATHGLLKAQAYNWQLTEDWSRAAIARFLLEGRRAYAPGALDMVSGWILERVAEMPRSPDL